MVDFVGGDFLRLIPLALAVLVENKNAGQEISVNRDRLFLLSALANPGRVR
jgi:hypothetical protein